MRREDQESRIFNENLDRLLVGQTISGDVPLPDDIQTALDFARRMAVLRVAPAPQFQANLKARLLQKLNELEIQEETRRGWLEKLIPRELVWQVVAVLAVVIIAGGILWGTLFHNPPSNVVSVPPSAAAPVPAATPAAPAPATTAAGLAPSASAMPTAPASSSAPALNVNQILSAEASVDKSQYVPGETVSINMVWQNVTSQPITIREFPPVLSLMQSSTRQPVFTFAAGNSSRTLAPGEKAGYVQAWNQIDSQGRHVIPGTYYLELEEMYYQGREVPISLARPVSFTILPPAGSTSGNERLLEVNQSQTANGITITLLNVKLSEGGFTVSSFISPPADYVLQPGTPALSPTQDYRAAAGYSLDRNLTRGAGVPAVEYFSNGMNQVWNIPQPIPSDAAELTFVVNSLGKWSGPWQFRIKLK